MQFEAVEEGRKRSHVNCTLSPGVGQCEGGYRFAPLFVRCTLDLGSRHRGRDRMVCMICDGEDSLMGGCGQVEDRLWGATLMHFPSTEGKGKFHRYSFHLWGQLCRDAIVVDEVRNDFFCISRQGVVMVIFDCFLKKIYLLFFNICHDPANQRRNCLKFEWNRINFTHISNVYTKLNKS